MKQYYQLSGEETIMQINGSLEPLTEEQVLEHQEKYGPNELVEGKKKTEPLFTSVTTGKTEETFRILIYEETVQAQGFQTPEEAFASIRGEQESGV